MPDIKFEKDGNTFITPERIFKNVKNTVKIEEIEDSFEEKERLKAEAVAKREEIKANDLKKREELNAQRKKVSLEGSKKVTLELKDSKKKK